MLFVVFFSGLVEIAICSHVVFFVVMLEEYTCILVTIFCMSCLWMCQMIVHSNSYVYGVLFISSTSQPLRWSEDVKMRDQSDKKPLNNDRRNVRRYHFGMDICHEFYSSIYQQFVAFSHFHLMMFNALMMLQM